MTSDLPFRNQGQPDDPLSWRARVHTESPNSWQTNVFGTVLRVVETVPAVQFVAPTGKADFNRLLLSHLDGLRRRGVTPTRVDVLQGDQLVSTFTPSA